MPNEEAVLELFNAARKAGLTAYIVHDAGRTQVAAGSMTVLSILGTTAHSGRSLVSPNGVLHVTHRRCAGTISLVDAVTGHLKLY